ncbi:MAG: isocitrate lyase/phosphoenolpyruvate mutase family protein [Anaerolineae bacterium]|nr:isocitrate lyase/phosphoenolpyruvate mutase family protein [Anaerolineae bacterium]
MTSQLDLATQFAKLHIKGDPLILFNVWDAGSAKAIRDIGAKAIATGSWSVAAAHGYEDGEKLPFNWALANLRRIVASVDLPVTFDMEGGYGVSPAEIKVNVAEAIEAGAIGMNFEDQIINGDGLYSIDDQCQRIDAARQAAEESGIPFFINARTDIYLLAAPDTHNDDHLAEAITRSAAYAEAGASGFFAPGLFDITRIETLCQQSKLPVNIMVMGNTPPLKEMAQAGVARISHGATPYRLAMIALQEAGRRALALG